MPRVVVLIALLASMANAAPNPEPAAAGPSVPPDVLKEFRIIEDLSAKSNYAEAARKAEALLPRLADKPDGQALLLHNLATLYGLQKHYAHAAGILEKCLAMHALPAAEHAKAQFELGQYYIGAENYSKAATVLDDWIKNSQTAKPEHYLLLADIYMRLNQNAEAALLVEQAIAKSPEPRPEWYQFLLGLYHEAHDIKNCERVLTTLIDRFPANIQQWNQLTGIYQEAGKEQHALAVQQLMYKQGLLKSSTQIMQLVQVLRFRGLNSRAADLLQTEIDKGTVETNARNLELLADTWTEAKELEKAASTLEKALALAYTGDTQHRLGQIYSELHDWPKAQQTLTRAVTQGGLKNPGGAYLLLGLAQHRLNAKDKAREAFLKAKESQSVRKTAQQWLEHIEKEKQQRRS